MSVCGSYSFQNLQRFKEMREMHGSASRDDRQKREQLRQEKEMAKFAQMYPIYFCFSTPPYTFFFFHVYVCANHWASHLVYMFIYSFAGQMHINNANNNNNSRKVLGPPVMSAHQRLLQQYYNRISDGLWNLAFLSKAMPRLVILDPILLLEVSFLLLLSLGYCIM